MEEEERGRLFLCHCGHFEKSAGYPRMTSVMDGSRPWNQCSEFTSFCWVTDASTLVDNVSVPTNFQGQKSKISTCYLGFGYDKGSNFAILLWHLGAGCYLLFYHLSCQGAKGILAH